MSPNETARLVNLIISTWPAGVRGGVWTEVLGPLHYETALATYLRLRDTEDRCTVAAFMAGYRARTRAQAPVHPPLPLEPEGEVLAWDHPTALRAFARGQALGDADRARDDAHRREREDQLAQIRARREERRRELAAMNDRGGDPG